MKSAMIGFGCGIVGTTIGQALGLSLFNCIWLSVGLTVVVISGILLLKEKS